MAYTFNKMMDATKFMTERRPVKSIIGKFIVTKEGMRIGIVKDITFESRSGEVIHMVVVPQTPYASSLTIEKGKGSEILIPYSSIVAIGDFIVVSEEDMR